MLTIWQWLPSFAHILYIYVFFPFKNKVQIFIAPLLCLISICLGMIVWCFVTFMLTFCLKYPLGWTCVAVPVLFCSIVGSCSSASALIVLVIKQWWRSTRCKRICPNCPKLSQVVSRCKKKSYNLHVKIRFCTFASYKPNYSFIYNKQLW